MDIEDLLHPVSPETPCGPDPDDYESNKELYNEFPQLELLIEGEIKNGIKSSPRWVEAQAKASEMAAKTKHLRLACVLAECGLNNEGLEGFRDGLRLVRQWCSDYWDHLYPKEGRSTLVEALDQPRFLIKPARVLISNAEAGKFSFEDYERAAENEKSLDKEVASHARLVLASFRATPPQIWRAVLQTAKDSLGHAREIESVFDERGGRNEQLSLSNLKDFFGRMVEALEPLAAEPDNEKAAADEPSLAVSTNSGVPSSAPSGTLITRSQAAAQLEQIARFFEINEPSSPVPFLLRRAQRCIGMTFMELVDELANDKSHAEQVLKPPSSEAETSDE